MGVPPSGSGSQASPGAASASPPSVSIPNADDALDAAPVGSVIWHCSYEDSGPDVGISLKLGDNRMLWCGEITSRRYREQPECADLGGECGWWIIFYDGPISRVIAKCCDADAAKDAFEIVGWLIRGTQFDCDLATGCADDQRFGQLNDDAFRAAAAHALEALRERAAAPTPAPLSASGIEARSDETPQAAQPEGQEPGPKGDAQPPAEDTTRG